MKSILHFAIFLSLSLQDICQFSLNGSGQHDNSTSQYNFDNQDFEKEIFSSLNQDSSQHVNQIVFRSSILQNHTFRNQLLDNYSTAMLKNLRKPQSQMVAALSNM